MTCKRNLLVHCHFKLRNYQLQSYKKLIYLIIIISAFLLIDESWDIGSPQSFAGSTGKIDKDDNEQTGFKESGTGSEKNEGETAEKQQQEMKEVHDFFDL